MKKAVWQGQVLAQSDDIVTVEGNAYFPAESINKEFFTDSKTTSYCGWKGDAKYYNVEVDGQSNNDAAWYYADPKPAAEEIRGRVAFWKGVEVLDG
ncbi:MAG: DUF427 domain-containing protein [Bacteroidota bacterium]